MNYQPGNEPGKNSTLHGRDHAACESIQQEFSAYLDGAVSGVEMAAIAAHLDGCHHCAGEFAAWRNVQAALAQVGPAQAPANLQLTLRKAIAAERARGTHLPWTRRVLLAWNLTIAPIALRGSAALAMALLMVGGLVWLFGAPIAAVQANDDGMTHMVGPHYLYSQVPPQPIQTKRDVPIVVEAKVDKSGRVYDYAILEGPSDQEVKISLDQNLLASVFKPATVFGVPVRGHVVLTFMGVSVRG